MGVAEGTRELLTLGVKLAASTVWEILREAGIDPAPDRAATTWAAFLRSQAKALLAADFIETVTLTGTRMYILAVIEHASRRIRILGATAQPSVAWVTQAARNLVMDIEDAGCRVKYLIRDRDGKYPGMFDTILADAGITLLRSGVRVPRMNAVVERWVRTCRRELLDRTLIWNQRHLLHALREFEDFYNQHRPHQGIANARPLAPLPEPITDVDRFAHLNIHRHDRLGGVLREYTHAVTCADDLLGRNKVEFKLVLPTIVGFDFRPLWMRSKRSCYVDHYTLCEAKVTGREMVDPRVSGKPPAGTFRLDRHGRGARRRRPKGPLGMSI